MKKVVRRPNSSRMRSERPLPVTAPMRAHISWTDDEGHGDWDHGPEQAVAVLGAGKRVGENAAGVVIDVGGDEAGAEDGEHEQNGRAESSPGEARGDRLAVRGSFLHLTGWVMKGAVTRLVRLRGVRGVEWSG